MSPYKTYERAIMELEQRLEDEEEERQELEIPLEDKDLTELFR